jgi:hypothetical protein
MASSLASVPRSSWRGRMVSIRPLASRNSAVWKSGGRVCLIVCSITRRPANPSRAPGSAMITSHRVANDAATPPKVGSVISEMVSRPASSSWPSI